MEGQDAHGADAPAGPAGGQAAFLRMLGSAGDALARGLASECPDVAEHDLNAAVVSSVLQAIFLRVGQEAGIAGPGTLSLLAGSDGIAKRMARACSDAGLAPDIFFVPGAAGARPLPQIPDDALRTLVRTADDPDFPVPCTRLPLDACAAILDRHLGTRIGMGEGYRIARTAKSAMLYTGSVDVPAQPVVDYLINRAISGLDADTAAPAGTAVRILDPACGAGIFLLAAYRRLAQRTTASPDPAALRADAAEGPLCRSVFGTDIDPESVSAARFVLLLAFIEEFRRQGAGPPSAGQIRRACSCLEGNIRCGNALIGPDYFTGKQVHPFNAEKRRRVNAFDWQEAFPKIVSSGGFDAVAGAPPPYRPFAVKEREDYFQTHYAAYAEGAGLYVYFTEKALSLLKPGGRLLFLLPAPFLRSESARPLRRLLLARRIREIADTGRTRILQDRAVPLYVLSLANEPPGEPFAVLRLEAGAGSAAAVIPGRGFSLDQRTLDNGGWTLADRRAGEIFKKLMTRGTPLERYAMGEIARGPGQDGTAIASFGDCGLPVFPYDRDGPAFSAGQNDPYLAGILSSPLARFLLARLCPGEGSGHIPGPECVGKIPVVVPDFDRLADKSRYDRMAALVRHRIALARYLQKAGTDQERRLVRQEIDATDMQIDARVYELYGLTAEEIAVVETCNRNRTGEAT